MPENTGNTGTTSAVAPAAGQKSVPKPNPSVSLQNQDETVLGAMNLYAEARGESTAGKYAVMNVVRNRTKAGIKSWGSTYKSVILAPYQFSWTNDLSCSNSQSTLYAKESAAWETCYNIAAEVMAGGGSNPVAGADHYLTSNLVGKVEWAKDRTKANHWVADVGSHSFYDHYSGDNASALPKDGQAGGKVEGNVSSGETSTPAPVAEASSETVYVVKSGDTLSKIAGMYNVAGGYATLAKYNGISNPNVISVGQKIKIPGTSSGGATAAPTPVAPVVPATPAPTPSTKPSAGETKPNSGTADGSTGGTKKKNPLNVCFAATTVNQGAEFENQARSFSQEYNTVAYKNGSLSSPDFMQLFGPTELQNDINKITSVKGELIDNLAIMCHGWNTGIGLGGTSLNLNNLSSFVGNVRASLSSNVRVQLYACGTASNKSDGSQWLARKTGNEVKENDPYSDGVGSFAQVFASALGGGASVYGHTTAGHLSANYAARVYGADAGGAGNGKDMFDVYFPQSFVASEAQCLGMSEGSVRLQMHNYYRNHFDGPDRGRGSLVDPEGFGLKMRQGWAAEHPSATRKPESLNVPGTVSSTTDTSDGAAKPETAPSAKPETAPAAKPETTPATTGGSSSSGGTSEIVYIVKSGDTLSKIASMYNVSGGYATLAKYNGISNPNMISVGQQIRIPGTSSSGSSTPSSSTPATDTSAPHVGETDLSNIGTGTVGSTASATAGKSHWVDCPQNIRPIYDYLMNVFSGRANAKALACGFLGNIYTESHYDPGAEQSYQRNTLAKGIVQWDGGRRDNLLAHCGASSWSERGTWARLDKQLDFLKREINGDETWSMKGVYNGKTNGGTYIGVPDNTVEGVKRAARLIAHNFERCAEPENAERQTKAVEHFNSLASAETKPKTETSTTTSTTDTKPSTGSASGGAATGDGYVFIGDSRTVGMNNSVSMGGSVIAEIGKGYNWLVSTALPKAESTGCKKLVIQLGVNDLGNISKYINKYNELVQKGYSLTIVNVGPVEGYYSQYLTGNSGIIAFNNQLNSLKGVKIVDLYSYMTSTLGLVEGTQKYTSDKLHYTADTYKKIYAFILSNLS